MHNYFVNLVILSWNQNSEFQFLKLKLILSLEAKHYFCQMNMIKNWLGAFRLRTLPLSLSGIILGSFLALHDHYWNTSIFVLSLLTTLFFQILSNLSNDLGDHLKGADNDNRVGPVRSTQSGTISVQQMKSAVKIFAALGLISAALLIYLASQTMSTNTIVIYSILGIGAVLAAMMYTLGKKAYGYNGMGDFFVFIFFGLVSVLGVYHLYTPFFSGRNILAALVIGLLSTAVLNLNNMRDHINDAAVGKRTVVVKMGLNYAKVYHSFLILGACLSLVLLLLLFIKFAFLTAFLCIPLIFHLKKVLQTEDPKELDPELKKVALLTFAIAVVFSVLINF
jgi:1,4-dihydroxy-2-naphthoate octaprenyltransferase